MFIIYPMVFAVLSAVISSVSNAVKYIDAFRSYSKSNPISSVIPSHGFTNYYGFSSLTQKSIGLNSMELYLSRMIDRVLNISDPEFLPYKDQILTDLEDIRLFESFKYEESSNVVNIIQYNSNDGILYFYIYKFDSFVHEKYGEAVRCINMRMQARCTLGRPFLIINKLKSKYLDVTSSTEIQYMPTEDITISYTEVMDAIAVAFAPAALGIVHLPDKFMEIMKSYSAKELNNTSAYPELSPQAQQTIDNSFQDAINRQKNIDEQTQQGMQKLNDLIQQMKN